MFHNIQEKGFINLEFITEDELLKEKYKIV
jgi:hypothetical protein